MTQPRIHSFLHCCCSMALRAVLSRVSHEGGLAAAAAAPLSRALHSLTGVNTAQFANQRGIDEGVPALSGVIPITGPLSAAWGKAPAPPTISTSVGGHPVQVHNEQGTKRVLVTKDLPGTRWLDILVAANLRVEVCAHEDVILSQSTIKALMNDGSRQCHGVIGQLTEDWDESLFGELAAAGGSVYSNYAVGYNNVKVPGATKHRIAVGNTPGVLTDTTAELAVSLTFAAARRVVEADRFMRKGLYMGWLPTLMIGQLLQGKTVGIIGAGRIGTAYARMMAEGHKCNIVYYDPYPNKKLESYIAEYSKLLEAHGEAPLTCTKLETVEEVLQTADVVSLHCNLDDNTFHLMNEERLNMMKKDAVLVNAARGPVIDEKALVAFLQANENFRCGLDVFEDEPQMCPGLSECENAVVVPHIASASLWTRSGMATLAAANVAARLQGLPVWNKPDVLAFVDGPMKDMPKASPSIVNAKELGLETM